MQLTRVGIKEFSLLKHHCRDFENYMALHHAEQGSKSENRERPHLLAERGASPLQQ